MKKDVFENHRTLLQINYALKFHGIKHIKSLNIYLFICQFQQKSNIFVPGQETLPVVSIGQ